MRRCACLGLLILAVLPATGCGGTSDAKRAVDARAEAMRFFPSSAPLVALLDTNDAVAEERSALVGSLSRVPVWSSLRASAAQRLRDAGIDPARMLALLRDSSDPDGIPTSVLAAGWEGSTDAVPQPLLAVAVSDRPVAMAGLFSSAARGGTLKRAGVLDNAQLYTSANGGSAFAVRDGVALSGATVKQLRKAILIRDGDRDAHLDDFAVTALLGKLSGDPPLQIYVNFPELATHDAAVAALELSPTGDWTTALENVALGVHSNGYLTTVDIIGQLSRDTGLPVGEKPQRFDLAAPDVRREVAGPRPLSSPMLTLATELAPMTIVAAVQGSELQARVRLFP